MSYAVGDEVHATEVGSDLWNNLHTSDVWQDWFLTPLDGLLTKPGMVDNSPLAAFLENMLAPFDDFGRRITLGTVDANTGTFYRFDQNNTTFREMAKAALSSASIPVVFPPTPWEGRGLFLDGGTATNVNVEDAIFQCMDLVDDESQIYIDVMLIGGDKIVDEDTDVGKTMSNWMRARSIGKPYHGGNAIADARAAHPNVNFRYVIGQRGGYQGVGQIFFNGDHTWPLQETGRQQAQEALDAGEGVHFDLYMKWLETPELQKSHPNWTDYVYSGNK